MKLPIATKETAFCSGVFIGVLGVMYLWLSNTPTVSIWVEIAVFGPIFVVLFLFVLGPQNANELSGGSIKESISAHLAFARRFAWCFLGTALGYSVSMLIQRYIP